MRAPMCRHIAGQAEIVTITMPPDVLPRRAVLMLIHETGMACTRIWEAWVARMEPEGVVLRVHLKAGVACDARLPGYGFVKPRLLTTRIHATWGTSHLLAAELESMHELLQLYPGVESVALCSGTCVPLLSRLEQWTPLTQLALLRPSHSNLGSRRRAQLRHALKAYPGADTIDVKKLLAAFTFHHQWLTLSRSHIEQLVSQWHGILFPLFRYLNEHTECNWSPDEYGVGTGLFYTAPDMHELCEQQIEWCYTTAVLVKHERAQHPIEWTNCRDESVYTDHTGAQVRCTLYEALKQAKHSGITHFFRKVLPLNASHETELLQFLQQHIWCPSANR